ncbi:hypothetical protein [Chromobacterium violaceum]|uniref:hypothetical protein n=1 Tax=Chromobacterium violaceum TaxID=536 RepID=UPI001C8CEAFD|nr:hypothetical protein [Chromobacterium violaceum]MBX9269266.1 hypothetical protein [Chromobacterium violaceum]
MTLIIAGHNLEEDFYPTPINTDSSKMRTNGIFVLADSSITSPSSRGEKVILGGFRKIYPIPIKIWKPYFNGLYFRNYLDTYYESECFVAIAGSTLTAQHTLNSIVTHLSEIRISYKRSKKLLEPGEYIIQRHCQANELEQGAGVDTWDEDMFTEDDYKDIINADAIVNIIEHSINDSLNSARKYKISEEDFKAMQTDFAVGLYCPKNKNHRLFTFTMKTKTNLEGFLEVFAEKNEIEGDDIAVLGMRSRFEKPAKDLLRQLISQRKSPAAHLFDFLNSAIDTVKSEGNFSIDRPSVHKTLINGKLELVQFVK